MNNYDVDLHMSAACLGISVYELHSTMKYYRIPHLDYRRYNYIRYINDSVHLKKNGSITNKVSYN